MCKLVTITFARTRAATAARTVAHNGRCSLAPVEGVAGKKEEDVDTITSIHGNYICCSLTKERPPPNFGQLQV